MIFIFPFYYTRFFILQQTETAQLSNKLNGPMGFLQL